MTRTLDKQLTALANAHRRRLLVALADRNPLLVDPDILETLSPSSERGAIVELQHVHLPMLAGARYIDWDRESGVVGQGARFDEIEPLLTVLADNVAASLPDEPLD